MADAIAGVMEAVGITTFDAVIPNEIGGMNAFEALLASYRFKRSTLDTDLVARAYPMVWQTVRCLKDVPIAPCAVASGAGITKVFLSFYSPSNNNLTWITRYSKLPAITLRQKILCATLVQNKTLFPGCVSIPFTASKQELYPRTASLMV